MSRKHKQKPKLAPAKFTIGTEVRVKSGVNDPEWPEFPLGGWVGTIKDVSDDSPRTYLIEWNQETLDQIHPVYRKRCERDDLDVEEFWLLEDDLELNTAETVRIEQPTDIKIRPLRKYNQEDRIRAALGLTSDELLLSVHQESLRKYHGYLSEHLTFPFKIRHDEGVATVIGLVAFDDCDEEHGLLCHVLNDGKETEEPLADMELASGGKNRQLIEDYSFWLFHHQEEVVKTPVTTRMMLATLIESSLLAGLAGASVGAVWSSFENASIAIRTGACVLGIAGGITGLANSRMNALFRGIFGAILGGILGAMMIAWMGALLGCVAGLVLGVVLSFLFQMLPAPIFGVSGGILVGMGFEAWRNNVDAAQAGMLVGGFAGLVAGPLLLVGLGMLLRRLERE